jgi:MFS transporter
VTSTQPKRPGTAGEPRRRTRTGLIRSWPYWPVITHPTLRRVLPGLAVSYLGDGMSMVAVPWLALRLAHGPHQGWWVAAAVAAYMLPGAAAVLLLRPLLSRRGGAQLAGWDATLRAVALGSIPLASASGLLTRPVFIGLLAASSILHVWGSAGRYTLIAQSLPDEHRLAANGLLSTLSTIGYVAGPAIAGIMVAVTSPAWIIGADAATFAVLALAYRRALPWQEPRASGRLTPALAPRPGGFRVILASRQLLGLTAVTGVFYLLYGPVPVALPITVIDNMHGTGAILGLFWTLFAIGEGVGGFAAAYLRRWRLWPVVAGVILGWGACLLPTGLGSPLYLAVAGFGVGGLLYAPFSAISIALFQRAAPPGSLTSVLAARQSVLRRRSGFDGNRDGDGNRRRSPPAAGTFHAGAFSVGRVVLPSAVIGGCGRGAQLWSYKFGPTGEQWSSTANWGRRPRDSPWVPEGSPSLLPGARVLRHLGLGHHNFDAQSRENIAGRRHDPGRADNWGNPDHDCLDVTGGNPAVGGGTGVGQIGGGRGVHRDQGGDPGEHQLARRERIVLEGRGGDVGERVEDGCFGSHGTPRLLRNARLVAQVRDTDSSALLLAGGITLDG